MQKIDFSGLHLFSVTPTDDAGAIAPRKLRAHFDRAIDAGVKSITVFGSTGAIGSFNEAERMEMAEAAVHSVAGRVPVIVGTGSMITNEAIRLSRHAREIGADAVLVVPTTYWPLTDSELSTHYRAIADASGMPMVLYNNPRTTGTDMSSALLASLCQIPQVVAIKESGPDVSRISETIRLTGGSTPVLTGRDPQIVDAMRVGASGWFSGGANIAPHLFARLFAHIEAGRLADARTLSSWMTPLTQFAITRGGVRVAHTALELMGLSMGSPRAPLQMLSPEDKVSLRRILTELDILQS